MARHPLNYGVPILLLAGSGVWCFPLANRLTKPVHRIGTYVGGATLTIMGLLFAIPAVNATAVSLFWFLLKLSVMTYIMIWLRGTFPRYRYDQLVNIGWKVLIPLSLLLIFLNAIVGIARSELRSRWARPNTPSLRKNTSPEFFGRGVQRQTGIFATFCACASQGRQTR